VLRLEIAEEVTAGVDDVLAHERTAARIPACSRFTRSDRSGIVSTWSFGTLRLCVRITASSFGDWDS
jgi:hypothetical protein